MRPNPTKADTLACDKRRELRFRTPTLSAPSVIQYLRPWGITRWSPAMKHIVSVLVLVLTPAVFAAPMQTAPAEPAPQASSDSARSTSGKVSSHDRHVRKHRTGNHHHRPRLTAKNHNS